MNKTKAIYKRPLIVIPILIILSVATILAYKIHTRHLDNWIFGYASSFIDGTNKSLNKTQPEHVIFLIADHHEHSFDDSKALQSARAWNKKYIENIRGQTDSYGNIFQYTWFYPYDNKRTPSALVELNRMPFDGYGEIEFHWHNWDVENNEFHNNLSDALTWFNSLGIMLPMGENATAKFGYVAGNWDLDNALGTKVQGPSREIESLKSLGGYADFTFPNYSKTQPSHFSEIYYVTDNDLDRSYDVGQELEVTGLPRDDLIVFQGPTAFDLATRRAEFGTVEAWWPADWAHRIPLWIKHAPFVQGKSQWRFVKTYTHGVQSREFILSSHFTDMLSTLKNYTDEHGIKLHYMTAREAFNVVKAAEAGLKGDPEEYKDYIIPPYVNTKVKLSGFVETIEAMDHYVYIKSLSDKDETLAIELKDTSIHQASGHFDSFELCQDKNGETLLLVKGASQYTIDQQIKPSTSTLVKEGHTTFQIAQQSSDIDPVLKSQMQSCRNNQSLLATVR
jgi:hypothetical protein